MLSLIVKFAKRRNIQSIGQKVGIDGMFLIFHSHMCSYPRRNDLREGSIL